MRHTRHLCNCNQTGCLYCDGGLFSCDICYGAEGSLTTDCPGERATTTQLDQVYNEKLDFREGRGWVAPDGSGSSMGDALIRRWRKI